MSCHLRISVPVLGWTGQKDVAILFVYVCVCKCSESCLSDWVFNMGTPMLISSCTASCCCLSVFWRDLCGLLFFYTMICCCLIMCTTCCAIPSIFEQFCRAVLHSSSQHCFTCFLVKTFDRWHACSCVQCWMRYLLVCRVRHVVNRLWLQKCLRFPQPNFFLSFHAVT